jgi:CSLREA domain-containing protein
MKRIFAVFVFGLMLVLAQASYVDAALASIFIVDSFADRVDANPGDGICKAQFSGFQIGCTLRAAVMEANAKPGRDTILLEAGDYKLTRIGQDDNAHNGDLDITDAVTIKGALVPLESPDKTRINANGAVTGDRVFDIHTIGVGVSIVWVTMHSGSVAESECGGAIRTVGNLNLESSAIGSNRAGHGGVLCIQHAAETPIPVVSLSNMDINFGQATSGDGGAIFVRGSIDLRLDHSIIRDSQAQGFGGGIYAVPAASTDSVHVTIADSVVGFNRSGASGGGIFIGNSDFTSTQLEITRSIIHVNKVTDSGDGGGIALDGTVLTMRDVTMERNEAKGNGGALAGFPQEPVGEIPDWSATLVNTTITGNTATQHGGGLNVTADSQVNLFNVTVAENKRNSDAILGGAGGGIHIQSGGVLNLTNTVLANNEQVGPVNKDDCAGQLVSGGFNLIQQDQGCSVSGIQTGNQFNAPAELDGPEFNGGFRAGPTTGLFFAFPQTHIMQVVSPLLDAGNPSGCKDQVGVVLQTDERGTGFARTTDGNGDGIARCDIGAVEFPPV